MASAVALLQDDIYRFRSNNNNSIVSTMCNTPTCTYYYTAEPLNFFVLIILYK